MTYNPRKSQTSFYQLSQYPKRDKKGVERYDVRKVIVNEKGEFIKVMIRGYKLKRIEKFVMNNPVNKYKLYPVSDIKLVNMPSGGDILASQSSMLNDGNNYTGYATVN